VLQQVQYNNAQLTIAMNWLYLETSSLNRVTDKMIWTLSNL